MKGLNYFQIDTDIYQDRRIKKLKKHLGCAGVAVYMYILCEIYRVEGCGIEWDEDTAFDAAEYWGVKESLVQEIVRYCGSVGLFDATLLSRGIITSASIQRRYLEMCKRSRRLVAQIPENWKIDALKMYEEMQKTHTEMPEMREEIPKTHTEMQKMYEEMQKTPSKIKENKRKENISLSISPSIEGEESDNAQGAQRERDDIFLLFFFKNFIDPVAELERFYAYYQSCDWRRSSGQKITDRIGAARLWTQERKDAPPRMPQQVLDALREATRQMSVIDAVAMLSGIKDVKWGGAEAMLTVTKSAATLLKQYAEAYLSGVAPNGVFIYRVLR